jgi:osmotically-inducible protein OsmY
MKNDAELRQAVLDKLEWEPSIKSTKIGVGVDDGVVTLNTEVESYAEKVAVLDTASRVFGVRAVADEIKVRLRDYNERSDADIARSAANAIAWNATVPQDCVKVFVEEGWVTLEGEVNWQRERQDAEIAVRSLRGIIGVSNEIVVRPLVEKLEVKSEIEKALQRDAQLEAKKIRVETDGTKITLRGKVCSCIEREAAERAVWATPGVAEVENDLVVELH